MPNQVTFVSAATCSLDALGDIFTRSFEGYFYPGTTTAATLSARVRSEQLDLYRSLVMRVDDEPAGLALLGLRGDRAWCGGFGVMLPFRGRGLAHELVAAMLEQARLAGARGCGLEVLTRNQRAIRTYTKAGFRMLRDLQVLEWRRPQELVQHGDEAEHQRAGQQAQEKPAIVELDPVDLLEHFAALHPTPAAWQRDLPALLARGGMQGLALVHNHRPRAYALLTPTPDQGARIEDFGAEDTVHAEALLSALQVRYTRLISINEPADSMLAPAFKTAEFVELDRQHEMWVDLQA